MEHSANRLELKVKVVNWYLSNDDYLRDITSLVIGEGVEFICNNAFIGAKNLKKFSILSKNIDLTNSGIGCRYNGEVLEDVTIYGYYRSTAEAYAQENGFDFKAIGDISGNNKIDLYDAIGIAKYLAGKRTFDDDEITIADYNADGNIDLYDAIKIAETMLKNRKS